MVARLDFGWRNIFGWFEQAPVIEPVHPISVVNWTVFAFCQAGIVLGPLPELRLPAVATNSDAVAVI